MSVQERPGGGPGHVQSVPGASPRRPESPKIAPRAPGEIFDGFVIDLESILVRFGLDFGSSWG